MPNPEPIVDEKIRFVSGDLSLEGVLTYRQDREPSRAALLLSPHPHFAGNLDNNVLRRLAPELAASGWGVLRFDYRGVGESEIDWPAGTPAFDYWQRVEREQRYEPVVDDARAALAFLGRALGRVSGVDLVGYSFGAVIAALTGCSHEGVDGLVGVAPPLARYDFAVLEACPVRKAFVLAADDFLYGESDVRRLRSRLGLGDLLEIVDDTDHFFRGHEAVLARRVREVLTELAQPEEVATP